MCCFVWKCVFLMTDLLNVPWVVDFSLGVLSIPPFLPSPHSRDPSNMLDL